MDVLPPVVSPDPECPALHQAAMAGDVDQVRRLIEAGADVTDPAFGISSATPLALALFYGRVAAGTVLAATPAGPVPDDLRTASALGDLAAVERWLTSGPSLATTAAAGFDFAGPPAYFPARATATDDRTVLDESLTWASRCGQVSAMARLVDAGADVNGNPYRGTPLLWAAFNDGLEPARWLLDHGADPDLRHDFGGSEHGRGATAMHLAAQYGSLRVLRLLLERGADPTIRDEAFGGTALDWARHDEQHEAVAILQAVSGSSL